MTTYNTYQEAKIANPDKDILKARDDWSGCHSCIGKFIADMPDAEGGVPFIGSGAFKKCNPSDHCITVEKFLVDGHEVFMGDAIININGNVSYITQGDAKMINSEGGATFNKARYILSAAALEDKTEGDFWAGLESSINEEKPRTKVEYVKCEFDKVSDLVIACESGEVFYCDNPIGDKSALEMYGAISMHRHSDSLYRRIETQESPQQREERERLEAAYDLYEESQRAIGCIGYDDFDSFKKPDIQVKFWLTIVDKTNYRKEKTHGTN